VGIIKASRINCLDRQIVGRCKERIVDRLAERERKRESERGRGTGKRKERGRGRGRGKEGERMMRTRGHPDANIGAHAVR